MDGFLTRSVRLPYQISEQSHVISRLVSFFEQIVSSERGWPGCVGRWGWDGGGGVGGGLQTTFFKPPLDR